MNTNRDTEVIRNRIGFIYNLGQELQMDYPNLAMGCRKNTMQGQVPIIQNDKPEKYGHIKPRLLYTAIQYALKGFEPNNLHEGYSGLIKSDTEYEQIKQSGGKIARDRGIGIFNLTKKQRQERGKKKCKKF